jgi:hypothetical protein
MTCCVRRIRRLFLVFTLFIFGATAQTTSSSANNSDPLINLLTSKGILTAAEASSLEASPTIEARRQSLARLLHKKGLLSDAELASLEVPAGPGRLPAKEPVLVASLGPIPMPSPTTPRRLPDLALPTEASTTSPPPQPAAPPADRGVVAAYAPLRVLPVDAPTREGMIPDIKLGSGARLKIYGFVKASAIYDSSSPSGTDMPLPYLNGDTGPTVDPEFHVRARNMRLGTQFEWPDLSTKWTVTGKFEADFEGNFSRALNRNISTIRSSMFSLRLAYGRADYAATDKTDWFILAGQDWTPFGSSTLPNIVETTGLGLGFGTLYERLPQIRSGLIHKLSDGPNKVKLLGEVAIAMPSFGNTPANVADQLGYGERQGADSGRPEVQGRGVLQWQLDKASNVAPAQLITSFVQGSRKVLVAASGVPTAFKTAFPSGAELSTNRYGVSLEMQLPTRFATLQGKVYTGEDLRFYFVGGLYSNFNDTAGLTGVTTATSIDGSSTVAFGMRNGVPVLAPERPVRTRGFLTDLGLPVSRWFNADPKSRAGGWSANLHYSLDTVPARDARRLSGVRGSSDMAVFTLNYKMNSLVTIQGEESYYRSLAANNSASSFGGLFLLRGIPAREWHDIRTELGFLFTF